MNDTTKDKSVFVIFFINFWLQDNLFQSIFIIFILFHSLKIIIGKKIKIQNKKETMIIVSFLFFHFKFRWTAISCSKH